MNVKMTGCRREDRDLPQKSRSSLRSGQRTSYQQAPSAHWWLIPPSQTSRRSCRHQETVCCHRKDGESSIQLLDHTWHTPRAHHRRFLSTLAKHNDGVRLVRTVVIIVIHELLGCHHIQQLQYTAGLQILRSGLGEHRHRIDTHVESGSLRYSNTSTHNLEMPVTQFHAIESFHGNARSVRISVLAECNSLAESVTVYRPSLNSTYPRLLR